MFVKVQQIPRTSPETLLEILRSKARDPHRGARFFQVDDPFCLGDGVRSADELYPGDARQVDFTGVAFMG